MKNVVQKYHVIILFIAFETVLLWEKSNGTPAKRKKNPKIILSFKLLNAFFLFHFRESTGSISIHTPLFLANYIFYRLYGQIIWYLWSRTQKDWKNSGLFFPLHVHYLLIWNIQTISLQSLKVINQGFLLIKLPYLSYLLIKVSWKI